MPCQMPAHDHDLKFEPSPSRRKGSVEMELSQLSLAISVFGKWNTDSGNHLYSWSSANFLLTTFLSLPLINSALCFDRQQLFLATITSNISVRKKVAMQTCPSPKAASIPYGFQYPLDTVTRTAKTRRVDKPHYPWDNYNF